MATFDKFNTFDDAALVHAKSAAQDFLFAVISEPFQSGKTLSLLGNSGVGKTMLCRCIWNGLNVNGWAFSDVVGARLIEGKLRKLNCGWFSWRNVSDKLKAGEWDVVTAIEELDFVVLDDIGAGYDPNKMAASKLDRVLRTREGKWTLISSNLSLAQIGTELDTRIASWLIRDGNRFIEIKTTDYWRRQ